ncbi:LysR substrate-binding domain-containing protein [Aurantiacibacter poecillastricola]|uniref:LysR substrate-binding domain-containing protein n=1 Tax=Aurantiacibacter poecillastricola TaxID=3064385 RepID=UPI00273FEC88|nr:LysR substrate-binding domain-containing protein [Aurantiacibacter sp. 219JJ12-13]MDP5263587.1 LysR substrate-binding domain-containing protein [Aurantiacibacter sp. 219JJ12-13]
MDIWHLNLRHLQAVAEIARLQTVKRAASSVNLTQPAITQALKRMEELLGHQLFERRHDGMVPTPAADLFVPRIEAALSHIASPHVTMSRMRALIALAATGSYSGASALTGLSLPSLHRSVGDLALSGKKKLVERRGKAVALTDTGQAMARAFRLAQKELQTGLAELASLRGLETRAIAVGAMPLSRARVLPAAVTQFIRQRPAVQLTILEGSRAELVEPLRSGTIDMMVGALRQPLIEPDLDQRELFHDVPVVVGRKGHPLDNAAPQPAELAHYDWVLAGPGAPLRDVFERYFEACGVPPPKVPVESGSVMTIREMLMGSDFLTLLSPDQVRVELEAGWLTLIARLPAEFGRTIGVTTRASWHPTEVHREFLSLLDKAAQSQ